jgi:S-phase kinase-associated protein 1
MSTTGNEFKAEVKGESKRESKETVSMDTGEDKVSGLDEKDEKPQEDKRWSIRDNVDVPEGDIKLISASGKQYTLPKCHAYNSAFVHNALHGEKDAKELKILGAKSDDSLTSVVEWLDHHKGVEQPIIQRPLRSKVMSELTTEFDAKFINEIAEKSMGGLYDLITLANYLDVKPLLHLGCAKVSSLIKGQPLDKIKDILKPETKALGAAAPSYTCPKPPSY